MDASFAGNDSYRLSIFKTLLFLFEKKKEKYFLYISWQYWIGTLYEPKHKKVYGADKQKKA